VVLEITTGDNPKRTDNRQRSRLRATERVLAVAVSHELALQAASQVEVSGEGITRMGVARPFIAVALRPPRIVARMTAALV
jgi:hypothetical protein